MNKKKDYTDDTQYKKGKAEYKLNGKVSDKIPNANHLTDEDRLAYLTGWLDARTAQALSKHLN